MSFAVRCACFILCVLIHVLDAKTMCAVGSKVSLFVVDVSLHLPSFLVLEFLFFESPAFMSTHETGFLHEKLRSSCNPDLFCVVYFLALLQPLGPAPHRQRLLYLTHLSELIVSLMQLFLP